MKIQTFYDERSMQTFEVYVSNIVKLRATEHMGTEIYLSDSSVISSKQPIHVIKEVIDNAL